MRETLSCVTRSRNVGGPFDHLLEKKNFVSTL